MLPQGHEEFAPPPCFGADFRFVGAINQRQVHPRKVLRCMALPEARTPVQAHIEAAFIVKAVEHGFIHPVGKGLEAARDLLPAIQPGDDGPLPVTAPIVARHHPGDGKIHPLGDAPHHALPVR